MVAGPVGFQLGRPAVRALLEEALRSAVGLQTMIQLHAASGCHPGLAGACLVVLGPCREGHVRVEPCAVFVRFTAAGLHDSPAVTSLRFEGLPLLLEPQPDRLDDAFVEVGQMPAHTLP